MVEGTIAEKPLFGCGDGVGDAVTDMSSSGGESGALAVVRRPTWLGEVLGEVVLWALLQLTVMGPKDDEVGSGRNRKVRIRMIEVEKYAIKVRSKKGQSTKREDLLHNKKFANYAQISRMKINITSRVCGPSGRIFSLSKTQKCYKKFICSRSYSTNISCS